MRAINFTKKGELEIINAAGKKTGLKSVDEWLANPQTDHKSDWIFRVKIEPLELALNGEKKKIETIDFFCNANTALHFFLTNALKDNSKFELQWIEEHNEENIGFSENHSNTLVTFSNFLYLTNIDENKNEQDLEINWENITPTDGGLIFSLTSPQSISLNNHTFTYDKVFWSPACHSKYNDFIIKRLSEWKADKKPFIIKTILSFDCWLSVKDNGNLYILGKKGQRRKTNFYAECQKEMPFIKSNINGWLKLPYHQREKFIERNLKNGEEVKNMENEIKNAIEALENNDNNKPKNNQENPVENNSASQFPWKIVGGIALLLCLIIVIVILWQKSGKGRKT